MLGAAHAAAPAIIERSSASRFMVAWLASLVSVPRLRPYGLRSG
jgi:hypothetical protein